jgi:TP901 family phage tail tape measure protein
MAGKYSLTLQLQLQSPANVGQVVSQLQKQLGGVSVNVQVKNSKQAVQQVQQLTSATNSAKTAAEKMGDAFGVSLKRFAAFSLASRAIGVFTRYLSNAVDESIAFDRQLNRIKQVTRASEGALGDLSKEITRLAKTFGVASSEITETALILAQAGLSANDTKVALEALTKTRLSATFGDINETAEGAVALLAQFGEGAGALERQLSAVNKVSAQFAVESEDLIEVIRRTGGVFKASGGNLEELLGLFTSVRATTREGAESIATALKTIFTRIQRPQTIEYLRELGVELVNAEGAFVGPFEAIKRLSTAFGGLEQGSLKFIEIAEQLGGYRQIGKVIPLLQQFVVAERARQAALAGGQSLTEEAAIAQESLAVQFQKVREEFLALIRSTTQTDTFKILTKTVLSLATSLIRVADALKPVLPLLTAFAAIKFATNVGSFFGGIGQALQKRQFGGPIRKFARGGLVPGVGNGDTVPAMLTPGEFVIRKSSVNKLGAGTLAAMNENRYASGGVIREKQVGAAVAGIVKTKSKSVPISISVDDLLTRQTGIGIPLLKALGDPEKIKSILKKDLGLGNNDVLNKTYELKIDGFTKEEKYDFDKILDDRFKPYVQDVISNFSKKFNIQPPSNIQFADNFGLSGGQRGDLFEGMINAFEGKPISKESSENNKPFDFIKGINLGGKLFQELQGIKYIDAKNSTDNENTSSKEFAKKTINQIVLDSYNKLSKLKARFTRFISIKNAKNKVLPSKSGVTFDQLGFSNIVAAEKAGYKQVGVNDIGERLYSKFFGGAIQRFARGGKPFKPKRYQLTKGVSPTANLYDKMSEEQVVADYVLQGSGKLNSVFNKNPVRSLNPKQTKSIVGKLSSAARDELPPTLFHGFSIGAWGQISKQLGLDNSQDTFNKIVGSLSYKVPQDPELARSLIGKSFLLPGFLSTSVSDRAAAKFMAAGTGGLLTILTNKAKKGINVSKYAGSSAVQERQGASSNISKLIGEEQEYILTKGNRFSIKGISSTKLTGDTKPNFAVQQLAKGGAASDTVPALLTPGEFVVNRKAAQRIGYGNLNRMNKQGVAGFAKGGPVAVQKFAQGNKVGLRPIGKHEDYLDPTMEYRARGYTQAELAPGALPPKGMKYEYSERGDYLKGSTPDVKPLADRVGDFLNKLFRVAEKKTESKTGVKTGVNPGSQTNFSSARTMVQRNPRGQNQADEINTTKNSIVDRVAAIGVAENKESRLKQKQNEVLQRYNNDPLREKLKQVKEENALIGKKSSPEQRAIEAQLKNKRQQAKEELEIINKQITQNKDIIATQQKALDAEKKHLNKLNESVNISKTAATTAAATTSAKTAAMSPATTPVKRGIFGKVRGAYKFVKDKASRIISSPFGDDPNSPVVQARAKVDQLKEERKRIARIGMTAQEKTEDPKTQKAIAKITEKKLAKIDKQISDSKTAASTAETQGKRRGMDPASALLGFGVLQNALAQMADSSGYANDKLLAFSNGLVQVTASVGLLSSQMGNAIQTLKDEGKKTGLASAFAKTTMGLTAAGAALGAYGNYIGEQGEKQYAKTVESVRGVEDFDRVKAAGDKNIEAQVTKQRFAGAADIGTGAAIGATLGSIFGPLGTVIGGLVGALGGLASAIYKYFNVNEQLIKEEQNRKNAEVAATAAAKTTEKAFRDLERGSARFAGPQGLGNFANEIAKANKVQREAANQAGVSAEVRQKADEESTQRILQSAGEIGKRAKTEAEARAIIEKMAIESGFTGEKLEELKKQAGGAAAAAVALRNAQQELVRITIENTRLSSAFNSATLAVDNFMNSLQTGSVGLVNTIATLEAAANNVNMGQEGSQAINEIEAIASRQFATSSSQSAEKTGFQKIIQNQASRARAGLALGGNLASALQGVSQNLVSGQSEQNKDAVKEALLAAIPNDVDSDTRSKLEALISSQVSNLDLSSGTVPVDELMNNLQAQIKQSFINPLSETAKSLAQQQQRLVELTKTRIDAENRLVEAQKSALELQLEGAKISAESFGGKKVTPANEFAIRARQFDVGAQAAGLGGIGAGSAEDIRRVSGEIRSRFAAQQAEFGGGGKGEGAAELDKDQRERLKKANQDLIGLTRQRIEQTKQELDILRKKNELEKSSIDKLLGGDFEGFMQDQSASAAANVLRSGDASMLGMFSAQTLGQAAKSLEGQLPPEEYARAIAPVLARFGIGDQRAAQVAAGATAEEKALMKRGQEEAGLLTTLGANESEFARMELKSAEMNIATANIKFQQALTEAQNRDKASQESLAKQQQQVAANQPLRELETQLSAAKQDEEAAAKEKERLEQRAQSRQKRENSTMFPSLFGMPEQQKQAEIQEEEAARQRAKAAEEERKRIEMQIQEERKKQQQIQTKARGGIVYASRGRFIPRGTDTVPAMLTPGEFVVRRDAVQAGNNLQILQAMNRGGGGVLSNGVQGLANGGMVQNITNNNNNINVEQFSAAVNKLQEAISQIPREFFHQFNGSTNMNVTGLAGLTDVMKNIASDAIMQMAPKLKTNNTGNVQINNSVLG